MPEKPEPLAAIFAEARKSLVDDSWIDEITALDEDGEPDDFARRVVPLESVLEAIDRIEAAAEREREIARDLGRIDRESDNMARAADALEKAVSAPGNAAAMREALEKISNMADLYPRIPRSAFANTARSALAAPARNCDRFADATEMARAFLKDPYSTQGRDSLVEVAHRFAEWALAPAKGGDHA